MRDEERDERQRSDEQQHGYREHVERDHAQPGCDHVPVQSTVHRFRPLAIILDHDRGG